MENVFFYLLRNCFKRHMWHTAHCIDIVPNFSFRVQNVWSMAVHRGIWKRREQGGQIPFSKRRGEKGPQGTGHSAFCPRPPPRWSCCSLNCYVNPGREACGGFLNSQEHSEESSHQAQREQYRSKHLWKETGRKGT